MLRRLFGLIMLFVALSGIGIAIFGVRISQNIVGEIGTGLDDSLSLVSESLDTVSDTLLLTKRTIVDVSKTITTTQQTAIDLSETVIETRPLIDEVGVIVGNDVPESLEAIQATIPDLVQVAQTVDSTLKTLSAFNINRSFLGFELDFDLGIDYAPAVPFDVSIQRIGNSLDGTPEKLRSIDGFLSVTSANLEIIGGDILSLSANLEDINGNLEDMPPLIDEYLATVTTVNDNLRRSRASLANQLDQVKTGLMWVFVWFGLTQLAPLYLGMELLLGRRRIDN